MRNYEVVFIAQPDLDETTLKTVVEKVSAWITESGGAVDKVDVWGKRRLAYRIRKQREGIYVLLNAQMAPAFTRDLERNLQFLEPVMRFMVTVAA